MKSLFVVEIICILLQFVLFIPFYIVYRNDCKEIGRENLAVSLRERFFHWCILFPIWLVPILRR